MNQRIGRLIYYAHNFEYCKLHYALLGAIVIHFGVIYFLGNKISIPNIPSTPTLEITLAKTEADKAPEQADYFADKAQQGGGESDIKHIPQEESLPTITGAGIPLNSGQTQAEIITTINSNSASEIPIDNNKTVIPENNIIQDLNAAEIEMSNLSEIVARQQEAWAKRPRRRHLSAATFEVRDAQYLELWRRHIEQVGNENYPPEAISRKLSGELRVLVAINPDGSLHDVKIRRSSGNQVLDDAALNIVRLAAPFEPLTSEMKQDTDILEIIRTWRFSNEGLITT